MALSGFKVEGLSQYVRNLQALGLEVSDLKEAFAAVAQKGADIAADYAPKRSGRLAGSIRGNKAKAKAVVAAGGRGAPYAGAINYGWPRRGIAPSSFMQRADEALRPYALHELDSEIQSKIRQKGLT